MSEQPQDSNQKEHKSALELMEVVDALSEEVKDLALQLALYLAKAKKSSEKLRQMEPEFVRLVNGSVKVIQEVTVILNAARNNEKMLYQPPSGKPSRDRLESRLEAIVGQCNDILGSLAQVRDLMA